MASHTPINFAALADALLQRVDSLLPVWLPNGVERSNRWYVGDFDGSPGESANVNMLTGQWIDNGAPDDHGGDLTSLYARIHGKNNGEAAHELMRDLGWERPGYEAPRPVQTSASRSEEQGDARPQAPDGGEPAEPRRKRAEPKWRAVVPVPPHAPKPGFVFGYRDKKAGNAWVELDAVKTWEYRLDDKLFGYVARFERISSDGELVKDTVARTWCEALDDGQGHQRWHWKQWEAPRPLYVPATVLSADKSLPVVLVEGEKCAEAGFQMLGHEFDFVTWPGGCKAWAHANWAWLEGRTVYMWPDCDAQRERLTKAEKEAGGVVALLKDCLPRAKQPGTKAMVDIGTELLANRGCTVFMCNIPAPGAVADGWDIADAIAEGWDAKRVRDFIRSASVFVPTNDEARAKVNSTPSIAGADEDDEALTWRSALLYSSTGAIKACRENAVLALDGLPEKGIAGAIEAAGVIAFDEFSNNVIKLKPTPWGTVAGVWEEEDELEMGNWLTRTLFLPPMPRGTLEESVLMVAKRHKVHPVREEMLALRGQWDGTKRIGSWLRTVCMEEDEIDVDLQEYLARAGAWFLMAMVARVLPLEKRGKDIFRGPGVKFDNMLIFEGPQGWGKSTIAKVLGGDFTADTGLILGEKDSYQNIQGISVYEWGELDSMSKADVKLVKLFIASPNDRFRATFDRRPRNYPRQVVFVGTTNEDHYLSDPTGNRRFWPVKLTKPADLEWLRENRDQLLAEALHYLDQGHRFHPTPAEQRKLFDPQQRLREVENSIDSLIRAYLYDEDQHVPHMGVKGTEVNKITLTTLLSRIGYSHDKQSGVVMKQVGGVMSRLGWSIGRPTADKESEDGNRPRFYVRPKLVRTTSQASSGSRSNSPTQGTSSAGGDDDAPF